MSTTLFLKQFQHSNPTLSAYTYLSLIASVLTFNTSVTSKTNGTVQCSATAGGTVLAWTSPPLAAGVTIAGTITYNAWVKTSSVTGAPKTVGRVFKLSGGVQTQISTKTSTLVQSTAIQHDSFTDTAPTSTKLAVGDRIVVEFLVASTSATGTETLDYGGKTSAADGDTWVQLTESVLFQKEPELVQLIQNGAAAASANVIFPGICAAGNLIVVGISSALQSGAFTIADNNSNTYVARETPTAFSTTFNTGLYAAQNITGGAAPQITGSVTGSSPQVFLMAAEYGGMDPNAFDVAAAMAVATGTNPTSNSLSPNFANTLLISMFDGTGTSGGNTAGSNYILRKTNSSGPALLERTVAAVGTYTAAAVSVSQTYAIGLAAFKAATQPYFPPMLQAHLLTPEPHMLARL